MRADGHTLTRGAALVVFLLLAGWLSTELPAWSEGRSVYPARAGGRVLVLQGRTVHAEPTCDASEAATLQSVERPHWVLCAGDLALPLTVSSYASGVAYWPSALLSFWHHGDVRRLRLWGLLWGLLSILLTARLVDRVAGRELGTLSVAMLSVTSSLLVLSAILAHYEVTPWLFLAAAALAWRWPLTLPRAVACGLLLGLSVGANVKALFLLLPLAALAWRLRFERAALSRSDCVRLGVAALACVVALTPNLAHLVVDAGQGVGGQIDQRLAALAANLRPRRFIEELVNLAWFWADMMMYFDAAAGRQPQPSVPALVVCAPCLAYSVGAAARVWWCGRADDGLALVAAACGTLLLTFLAVSALLYDQFPAANHSPLYAVFGVATAAGLGRLVRALRMPRTGTVAVAVMAAGMLAHATLGRGAPTAYLALPIDLAAEAEVAAFLRRRPEHGRLRTLSATYNYAGIFDSLGAGPVDRAHRVFGEESAGPLEGRVRALLRFETGPFDLVVPARVVPIDEGFVSNLTAALRDVAESEERSLRIVYESRGRAGTPLIRVLRVGPAPSKVH